MAVAGVIECVECRGSMTPIIVIDHGHRNATYELSYRLPGDKPSFWTGRYPTMGTVESYMCGGCGRIVMYGTPAAGA